MKKTVFRFFSMLILTMFSFNKLEGGSSRAQALVIDNNRKIVVVGEMNNTNNGTLEFAIARYNRDGSLDATFNPLGELPGTVTVGSPTRDDSINAVAIDQNNKIVVAGVSDSQLNAQWQIARFNENGTLDITFNPLGIGSGQAGVVLLQITVFDTATGVAIDSQNRIVVSGSTNDGLLVNAAVARFNEVGTLDTTFNPASTIPGVFTLNLDENLTTGNALVIDDEDSIFVSGFAKTTLTSRFLVFKLTENGLLDPAFTGLSSPAGTALLSIQGLDDRAFTIGIDSNGRIVVGGYSTEPVGITDFALVRYLPTGILDPTFDLVTNTGIVLTTFSPNSAAIDSLTFDNQDNIVVTGFSNNGFNDAFTTARYTQSGALDTTFGLNGIVVSNISPAVEEFRAVGNAGTGVVVDQNGLIFVSGFSFDGVQDNFTTLNYLPSGIFNPFFNPLNPGVVITAFGTSIPLGNGSPYVIASDTTGVSPEILENVVYPVVPIEPKISAEGPLITNDFQPFLRGISSPNSIVTLFLNDIPLMTVLSDFKGEWQALLPALLDGTYAVTASATNPVTGLSLSSLPISLTISTQPPEPPVILTPQARQKIRGATVFIGGKAGPSQQIMIVIDRIKQGVVKTDKVGAWSFTSGPLLSGAHLVSASALDNAGNISAPSEEIPFFIDTGVQPAPRILSPRNAAVIPSAALLLEGEAQAGSSVVVYLNEKIVKTVTADPRGRWSLQLPPLSNGNHRIYATTMKKLSSEIITVTVNDQPAPLNRRAPLRLRGPIQGEANPGSIITLFLNRRRIGQVVANAQGAWSYSPPSDTIKPGVYQLSLSIADKNGSVSSFVEKNVEL
ncbi:hypothetical protein H0X06_04675 [Candidatus Dependentiae bacterium]|nr:hypothetical protein [Candidatus Dependentiae bacterium]